MAGRAIVQHSTRLPTSLTTNRWRFALSSPPDMKDEDARKGVAKRQKKPKKPLVHASPEMNCTSNRSCDTWIFQRWLHLGPTLPGLWAFRQVFGDIERPMRDFEIHPLTCYVIAHIMAETDDWMLSWSIGIPRKEYIPFVPRCAPHRGAGR
jgi:hypothetical protein